jgi:hypothetical protein
LKYSTLAYYESVLQKVVVLPAAGMSPVTAGPPLCTLPHNKI